MINFTDKTYLNQFKNALKMKKLPIIFVLALAFSLSACEQLRLKSASENTDRVAFESADALVFGMARGFCVGKCFHVYKVDGTTLNEDTGVQRLEDYLTYEFNSTERLSDTKFEEAKGLIDLIPAELLSADNQKYGCPDCHDQGGIYIEIIEGDENRRFVIDPVDTDDQSEAIITFKRSVENVLASVGN